MAYLNTGCMGLFNISESAARPNSTHSEYQFGCVLFCANPFEHINFVATFNSMGALLFFIDTGNTYVTFYITFIKELKKIVLLHYLSDTIRYIV